MYFSHVLYQVERGKTPREQREADIRAGQLAADFARLRRTLWRALRLRRGAPVHAPAVAAGDTALEELELAGFGAGDHTGQLTSCRQ